jgi:hypothetical protein
MKEMAEKVFRRRVEKAEGQMVEPYLPEEVFKREDRNFRVKSFLLGIGAGIFLILSGLVITRLMIVAIFH